MFLFELHKNVFFVFVYFIYLKGLTMNFKKSFFPYAMAFVVAAASSCGKNRETSNMTAQDISSKSIRKVDLFYQAVGLPSMEEAPALNDQSKVAAYLSMPPINFQEASDKSNETKYNFVNNAVGNFLQEQAPHMFATKIISFQPVKDVFSADMFKDLGSNHISVPYFERDGSATYDLSIYHTPVGLNSDGKFLLHDTRYGSVLRDKNDTRINTDVSGTVYLLKYTMGGSNEIQQALVTIPDGASSDAQLPLMMFAHGGDGGLTFHEMATLLQGNLGKFIVAAPFYPGEPMCRYDFTSGTYDNNYIRSCVDEKGEPEGNLVDAIGEKSPLVNDVNSLLALQNAMKQLVLAKYGPEFYNGVNYLVDSQGESKVQLNFPADTPIFPNYQKNFGVKTFGFADSRGGATLLAAMARQGLMLVTASKNNAPSTSILSKIPFLKQFTPPNTDYLNNYNLFSGATFVYAPSSLMVGQFRFLTQYMIAGNVPKSNFYLPMVPELAHSPYFKDFQNATANTPDESKALSRLIGFIASTDITFLAPYVGVDMQNWANTSTGQPRPGSILFLHGTQDKTVPFTESVIAKNAMDTVFKAVYHLNENPALFGNTITAIGTEMFSFQPDDAYYHAPCDSADDINKNLNTGFCFGTADGHSTDHGLDPAFLTSYVMNKEAQELKFGDSSLINLIAYGKLDAQNTSVQEQFNEFNLNLQDKFTTNPSDIDCNPTGDATRHSGLC